MAGDDERADVAADRDDVMMQDAATTSLLNFIGEELR